MTRPRFDLFLVSGLILFLELACIRWFPAHVLYLSFFTNTVLLACFVGMSVGCLTASRPGRQVRWTPVWLAAALACGLLVEGYHGKLERHLDVGNQANPEVVFFGAETSSLKPVEFVVPIEVMAGLFYFLVAAVLVGPGQELGRAFNRVPARSTGYTLNLLGSLAGIGLFAAASALSLPPLVWFAVVAAGLAYLLLRTSSPDGLLSPSPPLLVSPSRAALPLTALAVVVALSAVTSGVFVRDGMAVWSPYYRIRYHQDDGILNTNMISHQVMTSQDGASAVAYGLPYLFARDTGRQPYQRILIIGAGSGNDVSRALYWSPPDARIDAVEIDPVIRDLGGRFHPDRPYDDPRVTTHLTDGRTFLRQAPDGHYDLVVFALVDSLVLHSGASNIRLESYLFTREAFADVARVVAPDGTFAVYNFFRHGWIVARLRDALRESFGADPVVLTDPPVGHVGLGKFDSAFTAVFAGRPAAVDPLRAKFAAGDNSFWVPGHRPIYRDTLCRFGAEPPPPLPPWDPTAATTIGAPDWVRLRTATVEESPGLPPATDDWPFLYVRRPAIPDPTWRGTGLVVVLSLAVWLAFRGRPARNPVAPPAGVADDSPGQRGLLARSFLLGAGFMLIETRAIVEMALLFGSTWVVNTVVFAAVLVMSLAGNRYAAWVKPRTLWPYYAGLFVALGLNLLVPSGAFLGWPRGAQVVASCALTFAPVAFAGVVFAASFGRSAAADRMFGANIAGALTGGLAENLSLLLGFRWLLVLAGGVYLLSGLFGGQRCPLPGQSVGYNGEELWAGRVPGSRVGRWVRRVWAPRGPAATGVPSAPSA